MSQPPTGARPVWAEIDRAALSNNIKILRSLRGSNTKLIVPVKANAYGHDVVTIAKSLAELGVDGIATANIDDALAIRSAGCSIRIVMFDCHLPEGTSELLRAGLTPTVCTIAGAEAVSTIARTPTAVFIKVDAGLGRLGVRLDKAEEYILYVHRLPNVHIEGIYTHLPFWDEVSEQWASQQLMAFADLMERLSKRIGDVPFVQVASSAAVLSGLKDPFNTVAPGHAVYGLSPIMKSAESLGLRPVLSAVRSRLIHVTTPMREPASPILGHYQSEMTARTGVVILGLDNGWKRPVDGVVGWVLFRGRRVRLLSVTAEFSIVDLSEFSDATVGEAVTFIGSDGSERIDIAEVAQYLGVPPVVVAVNLRRVRYTNVF